MPRLRKRKRKKVKVKIEPVASAGAGAGAGAGAASGAAGASSGSPSDSRPAKRRRVDSVKREVKKLKGEVKREVKKEVKREESDEEEMMFDLGRERRRERGEGGAGAKKVGPVRKKKGGKNEVLGHYAHIDDAKAFMRGVGLKSHGAFCKWGTTAARPVEMILSAPAKTCKDCSWNGWPDFLGNPKTGLGRKRDTNWRSLEAATTYVHALGLSGDRKAWREWSKSGARPGDIPSQPSQVYEKQGWISFPEFLGYERHPQGRKPKDR